MASVHTDLPGAVSSNGNQENKFQVVVNESNLQISQIGSNPEGGTTNDK